MIELEVGGKSYSAWTRVEIERSLDTISGSFRFEAVSDSGNAFPIPRGQSCRVRINGTVVMTGYVDKIDISYSFNEHRIAIEGRDKTCDIVDSFCDHTLEFKAPITIEEVIKKTLAAIGCKDVTVTNKVKGLKPFAKEELVSGKIGEKAFEFMDKYAAKRQVVLTTDGKGNIVIARASEESSGIKIQNKIKDNFNTVLVANVQYDDTERYSSYTFITQANHSAEPDMTDSAKKSTNRRYTYTDSKIRSSRKFVALAEGNSKEKPLEDRAKWEANIREAKSFRYTCAHVGHSPYGWEGDPYQPNTLVNVVDEFADINKDLLIIKTVHRMDLDGGSTTEMELMSREAFLLTRDDKKPDAKKKNKGTESKFVKYDNDSSIYFSKYKEKGTKQ